MDLRAVDGQRAGPSVDGGSMKDFTDKEMMDWIESQTDGSCWVARQSGTGRGFRLHNLGPRDHHALAGKTAREAIKNAMNNCLQTNAL